MKKKNNDTKNDALAKKTKTVELELDELELIKQVERRLNELPVLTEAELDELKAKADVFAAETSAKGCWIGLGSFRQEGREFPIDLVQASGNVSMLALLVAEAMSSNPGLEQAFMLAVCLRMKHGGMADAAEEDDTAAEAEEYGPASGCELGAC